MLKDRIKRNLISHAFGSQLIYQISRLKNGSAMMKASEAREHLPLIDEARLAAPIAYGPIERVIDNNMYGQAYAFRQYMQHHRPLNAYIEHGLFWGGMIHADEYHWHVPTYITFSPLRKADILAKGIQKKVVPIGPYIHYATSLLDHDEMAELKRKLGRVLLVFPSKSIPNIQSSFDADAFVQEVDRMAKEFDSVLISLYYLDAARPENIQRYQARGWHIVTAGHKYDQFFLSRQRSLIELADATLSNEVGTHVGYCIHLNKPHYLFQQKLERIGSSAAELQRELRLYDADEDARRNAEKEEVAQAFAFNQAFDITPEQRLIVDKYWGSSSVMDVDSMRSALLTV